MPGLGSWHPASTISGGFAAVIAGAAVVMLAMSAQTITGTPRVIGPVQDDDFPTVNAVSGTPAEWVAAVCQPHFQSSDTGIQRPGRGVFYGFPNDTFYLPHAAYSALCSAKNRAASDVVLVVAQFASEDPMQIDLAVNGVQWYCFAAHQGGLFVIGTRAEESAPGPHGLSVSPVLEPLTTFGFNVYRDPGP